MNPVDKLNEIAANLNVTAISYFVLFDPKFPIWPGASKPTQHHYRKGGLAEHTLEVVELCLLNNNYFSGNKKVDESKLFLAALFHDVGKLWDYQPIPDTNFQEWEGTKHKRNVHHISRSALVWNRAKETCQFQDDDDEVLHCILSHHGLREWGSPIAPNSRMAWLLHLCDGISARLDDCDLKDSLYVC